LLSALCSDDYYEDTAGLCSSPAPPEVLPDVLTVEAIIEKYGVIVACDLNDVSVIALLVDPDASLSVGSINPRRESPIAEKAIVTEDEISTDPPSEPATIALPIVTETQLRRGRGRCCNNRSDRAERPGGRRGCRSDDRMKAANVVADRLRSD
jgi:hypothetical protein